MCDMLTRNRSIPRTRIRAVMYLENED
jgi:hypothetical protein